MNTLRLKWKFKSIRLYNNTFFPKVIHNDLYLSISLYLSALLFRFSIFYFFHKDLIIIPAWFLLFIYF